MKRALTLLFLLTIAALACRANVEASPPTPTAPAPVSSIVAPTQQVTINSHFGVITSGGKRPDIIGYLTDLGASWTRVNIHLDGNDPDLTQFLDAGINIVVTIANRDPSNVDTPYGSLSEWPNAGFPFKSKEAYQDKVRAVLSPLVSYLGHGQQIWVQAENEVSDAGLNPKSKYWRGDTNQYLAQLHVLYEAVKSLNPNIPVVLSSFPSESLDKALDSSDPLHGYAVTHMQRLLTDGQYDAADLHFYGCVEDIPAKVAWIKANMPADKLWISTENGGPDYRCASTPHHWDENPAAYEQKQAEQVAARLNACRNNGGSICLWFSLFDLKNEVDVFSHMGLLDPRMNPPAQKPAYQAFKTFIEGQK